MRDDQFGYKVTISSPQAATSWDNMVLAFMAHSAKTPEHLSAVLAAEPDFAMAHAVKGLFFVMLGRRELMDTATEANASAQAAATRSAPTAREMGYVKALAHWLDGRPSQSVREMEAILADHPQDALAMKISHAIRFILGDVIGMRSSIEALLPSYDLSNPARGYLFGCHAFSLEETGEYTRAETAGRMGLSLCQDDAWGLHAVAHVHDMTGNSRDGITWLNGREGAWAHCNNFRYHVWWHKALMHLDQGEMDTVLALYDTEIRKDQTDDYRDISNATSLLSRLELEGVDVGNRWDELADFSENRTEDGCLIFADLHYLLALVGDDRGQAIQKMMTRMHADARAASSSEIKARMATPGLSAATGLEAFGEGDYKTAFLNLAHARQSMQLAGGSHAQRDVFERLTIDTAIRAGYLTEAESILIERTQQRANRMDNFATVRMDMIAKSRTDWDNGNRLPAE